MRLRAVRMDGPRRPNTEAVRQIITLMEASLNVDRTGLNVRRESDQIKFTYIGIPLVARPRDDVD
jgi:hypothetical protein